MSQLPITLSGNLTDDPVIKNFDTGSTLTRMRVATSRRVRTDNEDENGNAQWADTDLLYIDVECWGQLAVNTHVSLVKGMPVVVVGRLVSDKWTDAEGKTRYKHIIKANQIALELTRFQASSRSTSVQKHTVKGMNEVEETTRDDIVEETGEIATTSSSSTSPANSGGESGVVERSGTAEDLSFADREREKVEAEQGAPVPVG
ncbi:MULTISPECIES: single-stranded DNA-binding protein [unclassified Corynebacterium]|uniref:single-stranded DNA-binding protein n=1 Tax=unclassified Corynebacterium TaxID=2624378 RepID=UPI00264F14DD|nr:MULTISPECIES: single-stranded DNA-binding protein [unclassified Corynebacterium]MDN8595577.1 single-stranded DNA-binding protein [Corynebacterium sp. P4_F2]WKK55524.1 single-stranded DNA-binding protein [Corynebacterium sp. P4-C1]WKK62934.1 single-stranded DNA-binding protein [Corynebacterium sp. P8-C1]